jgi:hypothetical protein
LPSCKGEILSDKDLEKKESDLNKYLSSNGYDAEVSSRHTGLLISFGAILKNLAICWSSGMSTLNSILAMPYLRQRRRYGQDLRMPARVMTLFRKTPFLWVCRIDIFL